MNHSGAYKPPLFIPSRTNPLTPSTRCLHCPATGHFYFPESGSLYQVTAPIIPRFTDMQLILQETFQPELFSQRQIDHNAEQAIKTQSNNAPTKKKKTKAKQSKKKTRGSNCPSQGTASTNSIKSSASGNENKPTVSLKKTCSVDDKTALPSILYIKKKSSATITTTTKLHRPRFYYPYNSNRNPKKKSYIYYILPTRTKRVKPLQIGLSFSYRKPLCKALKLRESPQNSRISLGMNFSFPERKPLLNPLSLRENPQISGLLHEILSSEEDEWALEPLDELALHFSNNYDTMIGGKSNIKHKNTKGKKFAHMIEEDKSNYIGRCLAPFDRRAPPKRSYHHHIKESMWASKCKNRILASSVHDIIHSKFTKNLNELMLDSKLQALLGAGHRKMKLDQHWMRRMEQEAIDQYKQMKFEQYNEMVKVEDNDIVRHPEKPWLVAFNRWVTQEGSAKDWPLLVTCSYKYPDSTIRHASKHRSFCLKWNETSYTLRNDHAVYTQIQCQMAITNRFYAELLVHTRKETTIVPVFFDADFWQATVTRLETFFTHYVLPYFKKNNIQPNLPKDLFQLDSDVRFEQ